MRVSVRPVLELLFNVGVERAPKTVSAVPYNKLETIVSMLKKTPDEGKNTLAQEVLCAIGIDTIRKEIADQIKGRDSKILTLSKNPAILLILGFILTTVLGTILTWAYQSREWTRQQKHLIQQRNLDVKKEVINEATKAVAEMLASSDDAISIFYWNDEKKPVSQDDTNRQKQWEQNSYIWRTHMFTLTPKLKTYFRNPEIESKFAEITNERIVAGNHIKNLYSDYVTDKTKALLDNDNKEDVDDTLKRLNKMRGLLGELITLMIQEVNQDSNTDIAY